MTTSISTDLQGLVVGCVNLDLVDPITAPSLDGLDALTERQIQGLLLDPEAGPVTGPVENSVHLLVHLHVVTLDTTHELIGVVDGDGVDVGRVHLRAEVGSPQFVETGVPFVDLSDNVGLGESLPQLPLVKGVFELVAVLPPFLGHEELFLELG